jgi:hypothetical protein
MNRSIYTRVRRSIRDNGLRYTAQHAIDTDDFDTLFICDDLANILKETDWLAMRAQFARTTPGAIAFRLTTSIL